MRMADSDFEEQDGIEDGDKDSSYGGEVES